MPPNKRESGGGLCWKDIPLYDYISKKHQEGGAIIAWPL